MKPPVFLSVRPSSSKSAETHLNCSVNSVLVTYTPDISVDDSAVVLRVKSQNTRAVIAMYRSQRNPRPS